MSYCIGDQVDFTTPVKGDPYLVQGIVRYPNGTETVHEATVEDGEALITVPTLQQPKKHGLRWNVWQNYGDPKPAESDERPFWVQETACSNPFEEPRLVMTSPIAWKHTGFGSAYSQNITVLPHTPRAGDIVLLYIWNKTANSTSTIGSGSEGWTRIWNHNDASAVSNEIWWKRWSDGDNTTWENQNTTGILLTWTATIRGCVASGSPIDVINSTANTEFDAPAPSVTTTGSDRFILRSYLSAVIGETDEPGVILTHTDSDDGRITRVPWVYVNLVNRVALAAHTKSLKATAGATGTASVTCDTDSEVIRWTSTIALIDA